MLTILILAVTTSLFLAAQAIERAPATLARGT
jgi:hypothetical protein